MLQQEELEAKRRGEDEERKRRAEASKAEMMAANAQQMRLKEEREAAFKREEDEFRARMLAKVRCGTGRGGVEVEAPLSTRSDAAPPTPLLLPACLPTTITTTTTEALCLGRPHRADDPNPLGPAASPHTHTFPHTHTHTGMHTSNPKP